MDHPYFILYSFMEKNPLVWKELIYRERQIYDKTDENAISYFN